MDGHIVKVSNTKHIIQDKEILFIFLVFINYIYIFGYLANVDLPGNFTHPLGWWGWFDQGEYLKGARDFANFQFNPENHFYPPGYPLMGALFIKLMPVHPFFIINLLSFNTVIVSFYAFAQKYLSEKLVLLVLFLFLILDNISFKNYLIPWTTTPVAACIGIMIWIISLDNNNIIHYSIFGLVSGLIFLTRPVDITVTIPLYICIIYRLLKENIISRKKYKYLLKIGMTIIIYFIIVLLSFFSINYIIHRNIFGSYFRVMNNNGFFFSDLPEKFVSIFLDSSTLYLEPRAAILEKRPWFFISFIGIVLSFVRREKILMTISFSFFIYLGIYLSYADLLPHGLWRYRNVHYFTWMMPYIGLFAFYTVFELYKDFNKKHILAIILPLLLITSLDLKMKENSFLQREIVDLEDRKALRFTFDRKTEIDTIDLKNTEGPYHSIYFGQHEIQVDAINLRNVSEVRVLPAPWGVRVMFIRPVIAKEVFIKLEPAISVNADINLATPARYVFCISWPKWLLSRFQTK